DLRITVPEPLKVGSNGTLVNVSEVAEGWSEFHWKERYPIATYLVSLAIFDYDIYTDYFRYTDTDSMPVVYYVYPEHKYLIEGDYEATIPALEIFSDLFGLYPFIEEKYGHAEFGRGGGMEHQTLTSLGGSSVPLIVHELAHQWWGNLITCADFHHIWLNEGFATYSEALYWEATAGKEAYFQDMAANAYHGPGSIYVENLSQRLRIFNYDLSYRKASWVPHMLRHVVGDAPFFQILHDYYADERLQYASATTEDFQRVAEAVYGHSLGWFFAEWIYGTWYPEYRYYWDSEAVGGQWEVLLTIEQKTNATQLFKMPLDVEIQMPGGDTTLVIWDSLAIQQYRFLLPEIPTQVLIDPEKWVLSEVFLSREPINGPGLYPNYPNPLSVSTGTTVLFQSVGEGPVSLHIYNILGQRVRTLVDRNLPADLYQFHWNGRNEQGKIASAGIYFVEFKSGHYRKTRKLILIP
ncbi:T9SS type A sorting domain-containing protein, partial [bacterium]|nr:T9SS type A sorting domain-containing protein [bacterium]